MKKRILSIFLAIAMLLSCIPSAIAQQSGFAPSDGSSSSSTTTNKGEGGLKLPEATDFANNSGFAPGEDKIIYDADGRFSLKVEEPEADEVVNLIVVMKQKSQLEAGFQTMDISNRTDKLVAFEKNQIATLSTLKNELNAASFAKDESFKINYTYTVAMTGLSVTTEYGNKEAIEKMAGVDYVYVSPTFSLPEVTPSTANATEMIGADKVNETGFTGKGMKVAILDTGIVVDHPSFGELSEDQLTDTSLTKEKVAEIWDTLNASKTTLRNQSYYNSKLPFIFNYDGMNFDVSHSISDHGTHVAGITAANKIDSTTVVGVAPEAQIIVMQVFTTSGGANWSTIMAALEDCVRLDVDACNLSLGSAAGFTTGNMTKVLDLFEKTDIEVLIAAGNDTHTGIGNLTGTNMSPAGNPDTGLVGQPASFFGALSVASVDNDGYNMLYVTVGGKKIGYNDSAVSSFTKFAANYANKTLEFVPIGGYGEAKDYEGVDVKGKVALVSRGSTSFPEKQAAAQEAGAIAVIIYNNASGLLNIQINDGEGNIPAVFISQVSGQYMLEQYNAGTKTLTVCDGTPATIRVDRTLSDFSSWGVTPDLKLKPEISGVGGSIYSSVDPSISGSYYDTMSGTSMATPQITGAMAVLMQYLREACPDVKEDELRRLAANLMMSTADPVMAGLTTEVSPRGQGAGLVNLTRATKSLAYLSAPDAYETRPKGEFGDDDDKTGVYEFLFTITNISATETLVYTFDGSVITEAVSIVDGKKYMSGTPYQLGADVEVLIKGSGDTTEFLVYDFNDDGEITTADARVILLHISGMQKLDEDNKHYAYLDVNGDGKIDEADVDVILNYCADLKVDVDMTKKTMTGTLDQILESVTVEAGKSVTLTARITLTEDDKQYIDDNFENGMYVEGFLYLNTETEGSSLNMPFMGFYGDWSAAPIFDSADEDEATMYPLRIYTNYAQLGTNPYITIGKGGDEYNAFSYSNPLAEIDVGLLRNARYLRFTVTDKETGEEYWSLEGEYVTKSYYYSSYGMIVPLYVQSGYGEIWDGKDADGNKLPDGTTVIYKCEAWIDDGDELVDDSFQFEMRLDDKAPEVLNANDLQSSLRVTEDNELKLTLKILENQHVAAVIFTNSSGIVMGKYEIDNEPGKVYEREFDVTGFGLDFSIVVADYACNETEIDVSLDLGDIVLSDPAVKELDKDRIYGCETFDGAVIEGGWFSANKYDFSTPKNETFDSANRYYSAEYVNGRLIAQSANDGSLRLITPYESYWDSTVLTKQYGTVGEAGTWVLYDMALDYSDKGKSEWETKNNSLYAVGWYYEGDTDGDGKDNGGNYLFKINFYDGGNIYVERIAPITDAEGKTMSSEILTLGITTEGQMYGISTESKLYSLERDGKATYIGTTDFPSYSTNYSGANVIQSMGYDHNTDTMYWFAHSQTLTGSGYTNVNVTYKVDLETAKCTVVGTYGPGGQTCLFVPTDLESDLFELGVDPTQFDASEYTKTMTVGQCSRLEISWTPWNAYKTELTYKSYDESVATVSASGYVTAVGSGETVIEVKGMVWDEWADWDPETYQNIAAWVERTIQITLKVLPSNDEIYGYILGDQKNFDNNFRWVAFSDSDPRNVIQLGQQILPGYGDDGEDSYAQYQGGTYYNGYVYAVTKDTFTEGGYIHTGTTLWRFKVNQGETPDKTTFGEIERVGFTDGVELGNISFDYSTGRMYAVDYTNGGLAIVDLDTGAVDLLGTYSGDIGGPAITPAMCVTAEGWIIVSDMYGQLYFVDPDTLYTTEIEGSLGQDTWYYAGMMYDYNTGNIYWNPCMGSGSSPLCLVRIEENPWWAGHYTATIVDLGDISSKAGTECTILFSIPENEPETQHIPVEGIEIDNGELVSGIEGGTIQLSATTTPRRPTVQTKTWTSDNTSVATVDHFGKVTLVGVGEATITVSITNKDEATDGGPFTDTIKISVYESAGTLKAFLTDDSHNYSTGTGSGYYDFWLDIPDYAIDCAPVGDSAIGAYSLRTGIYYDGYIYAYDSEGAFYRFDASNVSNSKKIGLSGLDTTDEYGYVNDQVTGMAIDYNTGIVYGISRQGKLGTIDLDTGKFTEIATLSEEVFVLTIDENGTIYGAGSADWGYEEGNLYTINPTTGECTFLADIPGSHIGTGVNYYGQLKYNAQMTYDFSTRRIYLYASYNDQYNSYGRNNTMYMINLGDELEIVNLGQIGVQTAPGRDPSEPGEGCYLGLLCTVPDMEDVPVGEVNGFILNKTLARIAVGDTLQLEAIARPSNALNKDVTWSSSDESIATVDQNGLVNGVADGKVTITVTSKQSGATATCELTVMETEGITFSTAYTVSAQKDALIKFNPTLPGATPEIVTSFSGGSKIAGLAYDGDAGFYYVVTNGGIGYVYYYDLAAQSATLKGSIYTVTDISDIAYDPVENALYVASGWYVMQFMLDRLGDSMLYWSASIDTSYMWGMPSARAIDFHDGYCYFLARGYQGTELYRVGRDMLSSQVEMVTSKIDLVIANMVNEMCWDENRGCFYVTDSANNLYELFIDSENTYTDTYFGKECYEHELVKVGPLGDGIDINGLMILE